jgi:hypothetical protein
VPSDKKQEKIRVQFVSGWFGVDGGLERPPAGTIACPTGRPTAHLGTANASGRLFRCQAIFSRLRYTTRDLHEAGETVPTLRRALLAWTS